MKKIIKKAFFYFVSLTVLFLNYFQANWAISESVNTLYWVQEPGNPTWIFFDLFSYFMMLLIAPIVFLIWLYYYFIKKTKNYKHKWKKIMLFALLIFILAFILNVIVWFVIGIL